MSAIITCGELFVWKSDANADDSFLGLYQIPEVIGVGKHYTVAFDADELADTGKTTWFEVDPMQSEVQGEVLVIEPSEFASIQDFIDANSPKLSLWKRLLGQKPEISSFHSLLNSLVAHASNDRHREFILVFG